MRYMLIGNPNVGKSTLYNYLTDSSVNVGNYAGVTVKQVEAGIVWSKPDTLVDLPGTYNIIPNAIDEGFVIKTLLQESYECIINIVDAGHLKRNLHLTLQLLDLESDMVIVTNFYDELQGRGYHLDANKLTELLGLPVVNMQAHKGDKTEIETLVNTLKTKREKRNVSVTYPNIIEEAISAISPYIEKHYKKNTRFLALALLEGDKDVLAILDQNHKEEINTIIQSLEKTLIETAQAGSIKGMLFTARMALIDELNAKVMVKERDVRVEHHEDIDKALTHPFWGLVAFAVTMFLIYHISFSEGFMGIGAFLAGGFEELYEGVFMPGLSTLLSHLGLIEDHFLHQFLVDGLFGALGAVLVFLPQIIILFFLLALLETTGYLSRLAMLLDSGLSKFGYNGRSIVSLITGLGCTVPALMSTRSIDDRKERMLTLLSVPFVPCPARIIPIAFLASLFFKGHVGLILLMVYTLGIGATFFSAKIFSLSIFKKQDSTFLLEIPHYRKPQWRHMFRQTYIQVKDFLKRAGTYILIGIIVVWLLSNLGPQGIAEAEDSFLAIISGAISIIFEPLGLGDWRLTSALISGFIAKESVLASMVILFGSEEAILALGALNAMTFIIFVALYTPCLATIATIKQETQSCKWTLFAVIYPFLLAYFVSLIARLIFSIWL